MTVESARREMTPALAAPDEAHGRLVNAEVLGNFALRSRVVQDRNDGALIEFSGRVPHSADGPSMGNGVGHVVFSGAPAEIGDSVVCPASVDVTHIEADSGISGEGRQYETMDSVADILAVLREEELQVSIDVDVCLADGTVKVLRSATEVAHNPIFAPHAPKAGHGVQALVPEYWHPLLNVLVHRPNYDLYGGLL